MKAIFTFLFLLFTLTTFGQKISYVDRNFLPVSYKAEATYYCETTKTSQIGGIVKTFKMDGTLVSEEAFSNIKTQKREGVTKNYYNSGILKTEIHFKNGFFEGPLKTYYPNQRLKRAEFYEQGKLVAGKCFTPSGYDTTYYAFQTDPQFPGGYDALYKYLENNSRFPVTHINTIQVQQGFRGAYVLVKFVISPEGRLSDPLITRPLSTLYDREVIRLVLQMPKWVPAMQDGEPVSKEIYLPVAFR